MTTRRIKLLNSLERVSSFIKSYIPDDEGALGEIYAKALRDGVPVMRPETKELLKTQLLLKHCSNVLEIGTAVGYSALFMKQYIAENAHITTMEINPDRVRDAEENIKKVMGDKDSGITILQGDACELIKTLPEAGFDFVFMDAAKAQYLNYLNELYRVVKPGALIFIDNILQEGEILESHFTVNKRNRTIHDRMREFLRVITTDKRLATSILSVADGVAISVVLEENKNE
jgi:predicted O-methyltransferase YrrM